MAAEKRKIKEAKRKARRLKTEPKTDESGDALALAAGDDRDRVESRMERYRRGRVIERSEDGDDDASSAREGRRVIVIRREGRGGPGGIFENLFGN